MSKTILIAGSTGMTGGEILKIALASKEISTVITLDRTAPNITHKKLKKVSLKDFSDMKSVEKYFSGVDVAYWCIGVYTGAVDKDLFYKITVDYLVEFASLLKKKSPKAHFSLMSAMGADKDSRVTFAYCKGVAEEKLSELGFKKWYAFRPGGIYASTPRKEPNFIYTIMRSLFPLLRRMMPNSMITSYELATVMFKVGLFGGEQTIYENKDMKKWLKNNQ